MENQPSYSPSEDNELHEVAASMQKLDPDGNRAAKVFRQTFDQLYDGQRTGRYRFDQLFKTEKTHFGTLIEINLQREFEFADGEDLDFRIAGHDVDCKYSHSGGWMLPPESFDKLVLVGQASDEESRWDLGLARVVEEFRRPSSNRDGKTGFNKLGRENIHWLFKDAPLQPNALLELDRATVDGIMDLKSGQKRVDQLFRIATATRISRNIVATVAQQDDYMKRVRGNGGSRSALQNEGIIILGGNRRSHQRLAEELGASDIPQRGEFLSLRVIPTYENQGVMINGNWWCVALPYEPSTAPAPTIPME